MSAITTAVATIIIVQFLMLLYLIRSFRTIRLQIAGIEAELVRCQEQIIQITRFDAAGKSQVDEAAMLANALTIDDPSESEFAAHNIVFGQASADEERDARSSTQ